jgi:hypothetical protein
MEFTGLEIATGTDRLYAEWFPPTCLAEIACGRPNRTGLLTLGLVWIGLNANTVLSTDILFIHASFDLPMIPWVTDGRSLLTCSANGTWVAATADCQSRGLLSTDSPLVPAQDRFRSPMCSTGWYAMVDAIPVAGIRCRSGLTGSECTETDGSRVRSASFVLFVAFASLMQLAVVVYLRIWQSIQYPFAWQASGRPMSVSRSIGSLFVTAEEVAYSILAISLLLHADTAPVAPLAFVAAALTTIWRIQYVNGAGIFRGLPVLATAAGVAASSLLLQLDGLPPQPAILALSITSILVAAVEYAWFHRGHLLSLKPLDVESEPWVAPLLAARKQLLAAAAVWTAVVLSSSPEVDHPLFAPFA